MQDQMSQQGVTGENVEQFVTFMLGTETYGINILDIREIIGHGNVTQVPMMPDCIVGVVNLRGSVVPVVALALRFSKEPSERTPRSSILILEVEHEQETLTIGITVDVVNEVLDVLQTVIEPAPSFGTSIRTDFISGVAKVKEQLLVLLDIGNILSIKELSNL